MAHCRACVGNLCQDSDRWGNYDDQQKPVGIFCGDCEDTWYLAFAYMTRDEVVEKKVDAAFSECFIGCKQMKGEMDVMKFRLAEVSKASFNGYRVSRSMDAYTKSQFEAMFGKSPHVLGVKPVELRDDLGDTWLAYLVEAENQPRRVNLFFQQNYCHKEFYQTPDSSLHEEQASNMYRLVTSSPKAAFTKKVAKCKTAAEIKEALSKAEADEASDVDEDHGDDVLSVTDDEADAADDVEGSEVVPGESLAVVGVPRTPVGRRSLTPNTRATSADVPSSSFKRPRPSSASAKSSSGEQLGSLSALEKKRQYDRPAKTAQDHVERLPLKSILEGLKLGGELRWAKKFVVDNQEEDADCEFLDLHTEAADAALELRDQQLIHMKKDKFVDAMQKVIRAGSVDVFPIKVKNDLLERAFRLWSEDIDRFQKVSEFMAFSVPWLEKIENDDGAEDDSALAKTRKLAFDPWCPSRADIDGTPQEKIKEFKHVVVRRVLLPALRKGEEGVAEVKMFCAGVLKVTGAQFSILLRVMFIESHWASRGRPRAELANSLLLFVV